ncbi:MAG TPA: hypothetical protein VKZ63_09825 [Kofleriaceae bacterium]|nr:hypothetical protein [Kofleriaceae bacterium]
MSPRVALAASALAAALTGCVVDADFDGTRFSCTDGKCPDGYSCVEGACVPAGGDADRADAAPAVDAAPPDAGLLTCDEQFGAALDYVLCAEAPTTCAFYNRAEMGTTCNDICAAHGAECVSTHDATAGAECTHETEEDCTVLHQSQICVCTRGPAS